MLKLRSFTSLINQQQGIVLVETLMVVPILVFIFALTLHFTSVFYVTSALEKSARVAARQLAIGTYDEQTSGLFSACSSLSNSTPSGKPSAEFLACSFVSFSLDDLQVRAFDNNAAGQGEAGTAVYVELQIPRDQILSLTPQAVAIGPEFYTARTTMYAEPPAL